MTNSFYSKLCLRLNEFQQAYGLTQQNMADRMGLTRQAVSNYLRGNRQINVDRLERLLKHFKISLPDFLNGKFGKKK